ncbi:hypothetical protein NXY00_02055 [Bacteroides sp. BFG-551]|nr:hypothetical protein [Bacteroides sp. BFG-551]
MSLKGELKVMDKQSKRKYTDSYLNLTHATKKKTKEHGEATHTIRK